MNRLKIYSGVPVLVDGEGRPVPELGGRAD
jgi:hypothetical protein